MTSPRSINCLSGQRAFYTRRATLDHRLDAEYYHPKHYQLLQKMDRSGHEVKTLRELSRRVVDGPFGSAIKASDYAEAGIPFLRVADVTRGEGVIDASDLAFITEEAHKKILRSAVSPGDVVVAKTGATMGAASLVPQTIPVANIRADLAAITLYDSEKAQYLVNFINTRIGYQLFWRYNSGATRGRVVIENLLKYPVIWPKQRICERINLLIKSARNEKKQKEDEAKRLLNSLDDMLLETLGIRREPEPANTVVNRIFYRSFRTVVGRRIDSASNWKMFSFAEGKYPLRRLRDVAAINPPTRFEKLKPTDSVSFVPMDALSDIFGEISDRQIRPLKEVGSYTSFQEGDVIWAKITPCMENGKSAVAHNLENGFGYGSTEFHIFRPKTSELIPHYLHHLLRLQFVRQHARLNFTGTSGHQRVDEYFFLRMEIPFPPTPLQNKIVTKAEEINTMARKLFADARAGLEEANRRIEALILGEEANVSKRDQVLLDRK